MSRARRPVLRTLVGLILTPLLSGCVYLQYAGLFPSGGAVENSPTGKTIVAGVMVNEQGLPLSGIVVLEQGKLFRGNFRRGGIVDRGGYFAVEVPDGGQWGLHGYADGHIYHPESITVVPGKINRYRWVLHIPLQGRQDMRLACLCGPVALGGALIGTGCQRAATAVRDGREPLAAIAAAVGYQSEAAFNKASRRIIGMPPGVCRRPGAVTTGA